MDIYIPKDFISDGCTMSSFLGKLLGAKRYKEYCKEHDFLRRHNVINWFSANLLLARRIWKHGLIGKLRAPLYLIATTITYPIMSGTRTLPQEWKKYADYYRN